MTEEEKPKIGRPPGAKNKKGYKMSPLAKHQRSVNNYHMHGENTAIAKVISKHGLTEEETEALSQMRMELWKKMQTPAMMLQDEYVDLKTLITLKQMKGDEILDKDVLSASKLLLEIGKEMNRLTQVSADKRFEAFSKGWSGDENHDIEIEIEPEEEDESSVD